jgi:integral membrane protein
VFWIPCWRSLEEILILSPVKSPIHFLRMTALAEGTSFLVLLGIAMPLKYWAGLPLAVKIVGWLHGILFLLLCLVLTWVFFRHKWPVLRIMLVVAAALLPFGPFVIDSRLQQYEKSP